MSPKLARSIVVLAVLVGILGMTGEVQAHHTVSPATEVKNLPPAYFGNQQFVQDATAANIIGNETIIDFQWINIVTSAILIVTPNYNPGGDCAIPIE